MFSIMVYLYVLKFGFLAAGMDRSHTFCEESLHPSYFDHSLSLEECYQHCEVQQITHNWEHTQLWLDCYLQFFRIILSNHRLL